MRKLIALILLALFLLPGCGGSSAGNVSSETAAASGETAPVSETPARTLEDTPNPSQDPLGKAA